MDADRADVARQIGREPRAFSRVVVRCPFGRPAITEQSPYDPDGEPFPTTYYVTCSHLVAAISRIEAAGGVERWTQAANDDPALAESRAKADDEQRVLRRELAAGETGRDGGASLELGVGGAGRTGSLKCLHAHAAFALARPGYELGERIVAGLIRCGQTAAARTLASIAAMSEHATTLVRQEWEEGDRRLEEARSDPRRYEQLLRQVGIVTDELRKQVGQTYSLDQLAAAYHEAERWGRQAVEERAPSAGWPRDLSLVLAAAFYAYQRGATDYLS